jgi:hypothetical protein
VIKEEGMALSLLRMLKFCCRAALFAKILLDLEEEEDKELEWVS